MHHTEWSICIDLIFILAILALDNTASNVITIGSLPTTQSYNMNIVSEYICVNYKKNVPETSK
jgi:hypothetical protein